MNKDLQSEYITLNEILNKLYKLLEEAKKNESAEQSINVILDSIESVKNDKKNLMNRIRKSMYSNFTKQDIEDYSEKVKKSKLKKEQERIKQEEKDAKIVFNGQYYILMYCDGEKAVSKLLDRQLLDKNMDFAYDYNICDFLKSFDDDNGTGLYRKYRYGLLPVVYDFSNTKRIDRKAIKQLKKISKEASEKNENVSVVGIKKRTLKGVLATAGVAALIGLSSIGISNIFKKTNRSDAAKSNYSVSNESNVNSVSNTTKLIQELDDAIVNDTNDNISRVQSNVKNKVKNEKEIVNDTEEIIVKTQENVKTKVSEIKEKEADNEFLGLNIGSTMELPDMDLYYSSTADEAVGNTKYLSAPTGIYRIDLVSIVYKGRCLEVLSTDGENLDLLKQRVQEKYGDDVKISVNLDVVDENGKTIYKNVGWVNSDSFTKKSNVKSKVMVR